MADQNDNPVIWLLSDSRPGHISQLRGLGRRLETRSGALACWIKADDHPVSLRQVFIGRLAIPDMPDPDMLIAAGHGTHRLLLALRRKLRVPAVVLMKPSFPLRWVDAAIIPEHDQPPRVKHILPVKGVLNAASPARSLTSEPRGLILTGGPSPHYDWDTGDICQQILTLCNDYPDWSWVVASSRRTPYALLEQLTAAEAPNLTLVAPQETDATWLPEMLQNSRAVWVSPDSVSMVSEALTTGIPTGLLALHPNAPSRVAKGMTSLLQGGYVAEWSARKAMMNAEPRLIPELWEADRAARWLLERFPLHSEKSRDT